MTDQGFCGVASQDVKDITLVKALLTARDILLEELKKISKAVNEAIDISDFVSKMNNVNLINYVVQENRFAINDDVLGQGKPQNGLEVLVFISCYRVLHFLVCIYIVFMVSFSLILCSLPVQGGNGAQDFLNVEKLHSLSQNELLICFHSLGDQLFYLWKIFLKFHRFASYTVS